MENHQKYDESSIVVLEGLEAVRKRPAMYIGNTGLKGLHHCVYEIVDNSIDEALAGVCDNIYVSIEDGNIITEKDNGRGIPVGIHPKMKIPTLEVIMTTLHAGGKFGTGGYKVSGGLHGVGASVVNALSEWCEVTVYRDGKVSQQTYARGKTTSKVKIIGNTKEHGTTVKFKLDKEIFPDINFSYNTLLGRIRELAFLNKNIVITLEDKRTGKEQINTFHYEGGISEFTKFLNKSKTLLFDDVVYLCKEVNNYTIEMAMQYTDDYSESIFSFANNINTHEGGVHVNGFKTALLKNINNFARKMNILKDKDSDFISDDIKEGLSAIISVKLEEPQFEGQTKTKLGNAEFRPVIVQHVQEFLEVYFIENPAIAEIITKKALTTKIARESAKKARELTKRKSKTNSDLVGKLADCSSKKMEECEVYLVEGESAGGSAKQGRNRRFQAILPLKGKVLNVEKQRIDKIMEYEELMIFANALGTGWGEDFDISKLRYDKIIIMTDADVDGSHIRTLLLTFIYRYMKKLLEDGHVYIALPPLFRNMVGKKEHFTYMDEEQEKFLSKYRGKITDIQRYKGLGEMDADQLWDTTMNPETRTLVQLEIDNDCSTDGTFSLLMGEKVEPRRDFINENAKYATIDI